MGTARISAWKIINEEELASQATQRHLRRFAIDTGREYIHDGTTWQNVNITHRGTWSSTFAYKTQDVATYQGSAWRALRANIGVAPSEGADWTLFNAKGDTGPQGSTGPQGPQGLQGSPGAAARTTLSAAFTQPASGSNVTVSVVDSAWMAPGQELFIEGGGYYVVSSITDATTIVLTNRGYAANAAAGVIVASGSRVAATGIQGPSGSVGTHAASHSAGSTDPVDHNNLAGLATGDPHTQYQLRSEKNAVSGYAGLDAASLLLPAHLPQAAQAALGAAEIATQAESDAGTDDLRIVTPLKSRTTGDARYEQLSRKNQPDGYAGLEATGRVAISRLASGTPDGTKFVRDDGVLATPGGGAGGTEKLTFSHLFNDLVVSGIDPAVPTSGLALVIPAGAAYVTGQATAPPEQASRTYAASGDTYVDLASNGTYTYQAVANGAVEPAVTTGSLRVLKVVTNATAITAIEQRNRSTDFWRRRAMGSFSGHRTADQTITASTWTKIEANVEEWDISGWYDHATNFRFTPQRKGYYRFSAGLAVAHTAGRVLGMAVHKNGSAALGRNLGATWGGTSVLEITLAGSAALYANGTTDYFELYGYTSTTIFLGTRGMCYFQAEYIGTTIN